MVIDTTGKEVIMQSMSERGQKLLKSGLAEWADVVSNYPGCNYT